MTEEQKSIREKSMIFLKNEGWNSQDTNWFEEDLWSKYDLSPVYDNGRMTTEMELNMEDNYLNVILMDNNSGMEVFVVIKPIKNISDLFKKINDFKNDINATNFSKHVNSLFGVADHIFADDGSNNLVELSPNE